MEKKIVKIKKFNNDSIGIACTTIESVEGSSNLFTFTIECESRQMKKGVLNRQEIQSLINALKELDSVLVT